MNRTIIIHSITRMDIGGAQKHLLVLMNELSKSGINQVLLTGKGGEWLSKVNEIKDVKIVINPFLIRNPNLLFDFLAFIYSFFFFSCLIFKKKTIISHSNVPKAGIIIRWAAFFAGIRNNIFTIHGWDFYELQNPFFKKIIVFIERITSKITKQFISVCKENINIALTNGIDIREKTIVIYGGFDYSLYDSIKPKKKESYTVGTVTNFKKAKNISTFIKIADELYKTNKSMRFVIVGDGPERLKIEKMINIRRLQTAFSITGFTNTPETFIKDFDLLVFTSLWEGLPRVLIEAYLMDIPFVAFPSGGIKKFAEMIDAQESVTEDFSFRSLLSLCMKKISNNSHYYRKIDLFKVSTFVGEHIKIYRKLHNVKNYLQNAKTLH